MMLTQQNVEIDLFSTLSVPQCQVRILAVGAGGRGDSAGGVGQRIFGNVLAQKGDGNQYCLPNVSNEIFISPSNRLINHKETFRQTLFPTWCEGGGSGFIQYYTQTINESLTSISLHVKAELVMVSSSKFCAIHIHSKKLVKM